jgi:serine/threonine-protein kinase
MTTFEQQLKDTLSHTYDIERELGGGGMSRVFVAIDRSLGRKVVIKLLSPELIADVNRSRFRREIQVAAQLQHPHIVPLLSAGEHEDLVWYTMPFIAGESLRSHVEKNGPMAVADVVRVMYHVGEALDYAHGEGVIHRDIKAANILRSGTYALVTDFGVAKALNASMPASGMTSTGMAIGTPAYMAPEQLAGDPAADHRIDIYAVGLLAYELLNGRSPFAATTPAKVLAAVLSLEPQPLIEVRPDVPYSLSELVMRCLSKEPDERPATARIVLNALDTFSTASGEIRTMEHRIHRVELTTPTAGLVTTGPVAASGGTGPVSVSGTTGPASVSGSTGPIAAPTTPARIETVSVNEPTEPNTIEVEPVGYDRPKSDRTKLVLGAVAILVLVATGAFLLSQRTANRSSNVAASPAKPAGLVADSAVAVPPSPAAVPGSTAPVAKPVVATIDSQAIKDSLKRAAKAEAAKRAAKNDSLKKISDSAQRAHETNNKDKARRAIAAMLSNAYARKTLEDGATHKGGLLGKRKGDLQTQIDALVPWLRQQGLTYEQFKSVVAESGVKVFDEFGRIVPEALQQFAGSGH